MVSWNCYVCLFFKSISPRDFEKGALKSFILPNVESWDEDKDLWALIHSVLLELILLGLLGHTSPHQEKVPLEGD